MILVANPCDARESYQFFPNDLTLAIGIQHRFSSSMFLFSISFISCLPLNIQCIHYIYKKLKFRYCFLVPLDFKDTTIESQQHTNANINYLKFKINYLYMISYNSN